MRCKPRRVTNRVGPGAARGRGGQLLVVAGGLVGTLLLTHPVFGGPPVPPARGLAVAGSPDQICLASEVPTRCEGLPGEHLDVAAADLDGDGLDEVAWAGAPARLCRGHSDTGSLCESPTAIVTRTVAVAVGDLDGDGRASFVLSAEDHGYWDCSLQPSGAAAFACARLVVPNLEGHRIAVGDVNGDGADDLVVSPTMGPPSICSRSAESSVVCEAVADSGAITTDLATADLDRDGVEDIVLAARSGAIGRVCWGGKPLACETVPADAPGSYAVAAGGGSIVFATHAGTLRGCGVKGRTFACSHELPGVGGARGLALGDLDDDGFADIGVVSTEAVLVCYGKDATGAWCDEARELSRHGGERLTMGSFDPAWPQANEPTPSATASPTATTSRAPTPSATAVSSPEPPNPPTRVAMQELDRLPVPIPLQLDGQPVELGLSLAREGNLLWTLGGGCYSIPSVPQQVRCDSRLIAVDITNPRDLTVRSEFRFDAATEATDLALRAGVAYVWVRRFPVSVGTPEGRLVMLDIHQPAEVQVIREMELALHTRYGSSLDVKESTLYVGSRAGLSLLAIDAPGEPVLLEQWPQPTADLRVLGDILYVAAGLDQPLKVYNVTDARRPAWLSDVPLAGDGHDIRGEGPNLAAIEAALCGEPGGGYLPCGDVARAYDASDPTAVRDLGSLMGGAQLRVYSLAVNGAYALCGAKALQAFDLRSSQLGEAGRYALSYAAGGNKVPASVVGIEVVDGVVFAYYRTGEDLLLLAIQMDEVDQGIYLPIGVRGR